MAEIATARVPFESHYGPCTPLLVLSVRYVGKVFADAPLAGKTKRLDGIMGGQSPRFQSVFQSAPSADDVATEQTDVCGHRCAVQWTNDCDLTEVKASGLTEKEDMSTAASSDEGTEEQSEDGFADGQDALRFYCTRFGTPSEAEGGLEFEFEEGPVLSHAPGEHVQFSRGMLCATTTNIFFHWYVRLSSWLKAGIARAMLHCFSLVQLYSLGASLESTLQNCTGNGPKLKRPPDLGSAGDLLATSF